VLLWSTQSLRSDWMRFEFDWFRTHRDRGSILIGITDAMDPAGTAATLFWPEMIDMGLHRRPWYDFRGFRKEQLVGAVKLRDYEEAMVQLAADLNGYSPAEIQPIWWRNKVREQHERAEREQEARRRLELTECNARLEAARGWYERALVFFEQRRYRRCSRCLLNALAIAPPSRVPDHYPSSLENPGWSEDSWAFLRYSLALSPRLVRSFPQENRTEYRLYRPARVRGQVQGPTACWVDKGRSFCAATRERIASDLLKADLSISVEVDQGNLADSIWLFDYAEGTIQAKISPPEGAGRITVWTASRHTCRVALGTEGGWLCLWSSETGRTISYREHQAPLTAIAFSRAGDRVASACARGEIRIWAGLDDASVESDLIVEALANGDPTVATALGESDPESDRTAVGFVAFAGDDMSILFHRDGRFLERSLQSSSLKTLVEVVLFKAVAQNQMGRRIAYSDSDIVRCIDLDRRNEQSPDREEILLYVGHHKHFIEQVAFGADDRRLLTLDVSGKVCAWLGEEPQLERGQSFMDAKISQQFGRSNRGTLLKHLEGLGRVLSLDPHPLAPDRVLIDRGGAIEEWDLGFAFEPICGWRNAAKGSRCAAWLPNGLGVVAGFDDGSILLFKIGAEDPARILVEGTAAVGHLVVSRDGALIAAATEDGAVRVYAVGGDAVLAEVRAPTVPFSVAFVSDHRLLGIGCADGTVYLWDWSSGSGARRLGNVSDAVLGLDCTTDGSTLIASSSKEVTAWDVQAELERWSTSDRPRARARLGIPIGRLAISKDGQLVAYGCMDGTVACLEVLTGDLVSTTHVPPSIPLKPEHVTAVGISDDNRSAFAGLWDGTLCIVDLVRGRELYRFHAHSKVITSVAQSSNCGDVLTSSLDPDLGGDNQYVRIWRLLDPGLAPRPQAQDQGWAKVAQESFLVRHGNAVDPPLGHGRGEDLDLSFIASSSGGRLKDETTDSGSRPKISELRAALLADPRSPVRNLDLAMEYLAIDNRQKARDYLGRVRRFGGDDLIRDPAAVYLVGESILVEGSVDDALPWLLRAGEQGEAAALLQLGLLSMSGKGMPRDRTRGVEFLRSSAERGNATAAHNLGVYYEHLERGLVAQTDWRRIAFGGSEDPIPASLVRAFEWYQRAANAGYSPAQVRLGDFFAAGQVVNRDLVEARAWYMRAAFQGNEEAEKKLANLGRNSSTE